MAKERVSNQTENNIIEVDETVGIGFSLSIPSSLNFVDGKAEPIVEIKEVHLGSGFELNIKFLDYDDYLSKSNDEEKFGLPLCIKDEDGELIDKGSTVLSEKAIIAIMRM